MSIKARLGKIEQASQPKRPPPPLEVHCLTRYGQDGAWHYDGAPVSDDDAIAIARRQTHRNNFVIIRYGDRKALVESEEWEGRRFSIAQTWQWSAANLQLRVDAKFCRSRIIEKFAVCRMKKQTRCWTGSDWRPDRLNRPWRVESWCSIELCGATGY